ncbi:MAG: DUF4832 domain-containing protein [Bryobacterales bacterium]|nr:DUF4832 domain-containing protein [Bryobacterales bacterium]
MILRLVILLMAALAAVAQQTVTVRPEVIDDVLTNPGIGFSTFQRFNGDQLNAGTGWTEGYPIQYQEYKGSLKNPDHPDTTIAYFRIYWKFVEPEDGKYNWEMLDKALNTAHARKQRLMLRIAPYGSRGDNDVPDWYRAMVGIDEIAKLGDKKWRTNPEDARYAKYFGRMIRAVGARYDGHPDFESVDLSIVGAWGEGAGTELLSRNTMEALVDAYLDAFRKTPLVAMLAGEAFNRYALSKRNVGWRVDCLGDMGGFSPNYNHMFDIYPQRITGYGVQDAWQKAPISFEVCWVMKKWKEENWDVDYIIDQSLKWHISSFNSKSSAVPEEWWPQVNRWLKKMGYRFALRKFTYPSQVAPNGKLAFTTWWENQGVAPIYRQYRFALRLRNAERTHVMLTDVDIRKWLPGDATYDDAVFVPAEMPPGEYDLEVGLVDEDSQRPQVKLAIAGVTAEGWYPMGKIRIKP